MNLNNRRTGKDATKPRTLGLLGHSGLLDIHLPHTKAVALMISAEAFVRHGPFDIRGGGAGMFWKKIPCSHFD